MKKQAVIALVAFLIGGVSYLPIWAQSLKMKMTTEIPESITTPDRVKTRIGTLEFFDGAVHSENSIGAEISGSCI